MTAPVSGQSRRYMLCDPVSHDVVAEGCVWSNNAAMTQWLQYPQSCVAWPSFEAAVEVHIGRAAWLWTWIDRPSKRCERAIDAATAARVERQGRA